MKKFLSTLALVMFVVTVNAQLKTPKPSPLSKINQVVGLTDVSVEYSRPSIKGRKIFGGLVPYNKLWRTGANANTKITFGDDVTVGGKELKAGTYALYTKPSNSTWEFIFYTDSDNSGTPKKWDDSKVAATVKVKAESMPVKIETFTIMFDNLTNDSAILGLLWENTFVGLEIGVPTSKKAIANIEKTLSSGSAEANDYFDSARYYFDAGKDIKKAEEWIEKATEMTKDKPRFWYQRLQSLIYAKAGKSRKAIKAAKESLANAEKAGNTDYIKMNKTSLKEWGEKI